MALRHFVVALSAAGTLVQFQAQVAAQQNTAIPTEVQTEQKPQLDPQLSAEQQSRTPGNKIVIEGCVARAQRDGSVGGTGLGTTSTPNTADRDANSSETLDVFMLNSARRIPRDAAEGPDLTTYALEGRELEMGGHNGHRVQVTGSLVPQRPMNSSTAAAAAGIRRVRVEAIKMVSASCDATSMR
jgi:hypothetical protein